MAAPLSLLSLLGRVAYNAIRPGLVPTWRADRMSGVIETVQGSDRHAQVVFKTPGGTKRLKNTELLPPVAAFVRAPRAAGHTLLFLAVPCGCHHLLYGCVDSQGKAAGGLELLDRRLRQSIQRRRLVRAAFFGPLAVLSFVLAPIVGMLTLCLGLWYVFPPGTVRARVTVLQAARATFVL